MTDIYYSTIPLGEKVLYLSEKPANDEEIPMFIDFYKANNIDTVVVLIPEEDLSCFYSTNLLKSYSDSGLQVIHFPIEDYSIPDNLRLFHSFILDLSSRLEIGNLLIHCSAGIGRTGLVASGILISRGMDADDAIHRIRKVRPGSVETAEQQNFLKAYYGIHF